MFNMASSNLYKHIYRGVSVNEKKIKQIYHSELKWFAIISKGPSKLYFTSVYEVYLSLCSEHRYNFLVS